MDLTVIKLPNGCLAAYGDESQAELGKVKTGTLMNVKATRVRNYQFLKKFMALINLAFDIWSETCDPIEYQGRPVLPNKTKFRHDVTILAGYYDACVNLRGEVRLEAKSISFARMDESEFESCFSAVLNVVLSKVLNSSKLTEKDLRDHVDRVMAFDS